ncbi:heme utilization cystosolic carrier protein HutX [Aestuariivirga sp.]|uniref:heme utilization cystosolic carrier protein HutX n=1 Tax=Aestuariivirga sp. TaxID=2650926 RepID=UPI0039E2805F
MSGVLLSGKIPLDVVSTATICSENPNSTRISVAALPIDTILCGFEVLTDFPAASTIPSDRFDDIWKAMRSWGEVLFIVHTDDIVLECSGKLPEGSHGHGYFNIHGDSPIGGHIKASNCQAIALVDRPFHGRRSCSVQFLNNGGNAMFKVFVRRDKDRNLLPNQLSMFEDLQKSEF